MTNPFYNPTGNPATGSEGLSSLMRTEFAAIGAAFDIIPPFSATGEFSTVFVQLGSFTFTLPAAAGTLATTANVATAVATEATRATAAEGANATAIATETTARAAETTRALAAEALLAPKLTPTITGLHETAVAMPALNIDCNAATLFTKTITGNSTLTVSNVPPAGTSAAFVLELTNGGAFVVTWWSGVTWAAGIAPTLTASGVDVLGFYTVNGGASWRGMTLAQNVH